MLIINKPTAPESYEELKTFCKFKALFKGEVWKPILIDEWQNYKISNYGRLFNNQRQSLLSVHTPQGKRGVVSFYSLVYSIRKSQIPTCDLIRHVFYPEIADTHVNVHPKDGNPLNLSLSNMRFLPNEYYVDDGGSKTKPIFIGGEKTHYLLNTKGDVRNSKTKRILMCNGTGTVILSFRGKSFGFARRRMIAEAFIPNPHGLNKVRFINPKGPVAAENLYWTDRLLSNNS